MAKQQPTVELAGKPYYIQRVPLGKLKSLSTMVGDLFKDMDLDKLSKDPEQAGGMVVDKILTVPHAVLSVFIKDLPKDIFTDEEDGVTFPELLDALGECVRYNRLDTVKNFLSPLMPSVRSILPDLVALGRASQKTNLSNSALKPSDGNLTTPLK